MFFLDRKHAGHGLIKKLKKYKGDSLILLALPRGGVVVGDEIAKNLNIPLDVVVIRKIGLPNNKEFGVGAIGEGGVRILDQKAINFAEISPEVLENIIRQEQEELNRRVALYRNNKPLPILKNKTVILVDDGLATGVTAKAAIAVIKKLNPKKIIFASPVCANGAVQDLKPLVDEIICLVTPIDLLSIGSCYKNFEQVEDDEVIEILSKY